MALDVKQETEEQTQHAQTRQAELNKSVMDSLRGSKIQDDVLKDLGLSPEPEVKGKPKSIQEEEQEESEEEEIEESEEEVFEEESNESEEEEVVAKSKVQKRIDELTAKNKYLEQQNEELRYSKSTPKDEVTKQLEEMSPEQLKAAKIEVRKAQIKAQNDDSKLNELLSLEDKIDTVMQSAPLNFQKAQQAAYSKKAQEIAESGDIPNLEKVAPQIIKLANEIYAETSAFHKDVNGQATALNLAVKHFKAINSVPGDKSKETELKRQVNTLKRKTTLDTKVSKINTDKSKLDSLKKSAIGGTMRQKIDLVRSHPMFNVDKMIPDEFK